MSKETQLHMWTSFLERVIGLSGGRRDGPLQIETRRVEELSAGRATGLDAIRPLPVNFEVSRELEIRAGERLEPG